MAKNVEYEELSTASISDKRNIVISEYSKGGYTLGQQVVVEEGSKKINMFVKNSIQIENVEGLYNLRDALNVAISKIEKK
ncbi:MAG: hypothetical protein J6D28_02510 [Bacilli bacterium]|nr:hypothetical protein [Bacilli bacterium]